MFRYSMTQWIFGKEDVEASFERLKRLGYDGIEFSAEPYSQDIPRLKRLMEQYQLCCTSLCGIFPEKRDLSSEDPQTAESAVQYLKDSVDMAVEVGAPLIIVVPSPVGKIRPNTTYESAWNHAKENILKAADYAKSKNILLAVEAVNRYETYLVNNLSLALRFVSEISHPAVKLMADLFHMNLEECNSLQSLRKIAPQLVHVHIADNTRQAAGWGCIDFKNILYTLEDIGYNGVLAMEFLPPVASPYAASEMGSRAKLMDSSAEQSISYLKRMEKSLAD